VGSEASNVQITNVGGKLRDLRIVGGGEEITIEGVENVGEGDTRVHFEALRADKVNLIVNGGDSYSFSQVNLQNIASSPSDNIDLTIRADKLKNPGLPMIHARLSNIANAYAGFPQDGENSYTVNASGELMRKEEGEMLSERVDIEGVNADPIAKAVSKINSLTWIDTEAEPEKTHPIYVR
jgi:hypothetical protein